MNKEPQSSGEGGERDAQGRFIEGHTKLGGVVKGGFSLTALLRDELQKVPEGQKITYAQAFLKKMLHKAINEGEEQTQKLIMNYIEGLPRQPIDLGIDKEGLAELTEFFKVLANRKDD